MVFYRSTYASLKDALPNPDSIAVIGILVEVHFYTAFWLMFGDNCDKLYEKGMSNSCWPMFFDIILVL